jgi:hypothetical protein
MPGLTRSPSTSFSARKKNMNLYVITRTTIGKLYGLRQDRITDFDEFDPAFAIKFSILRERPSGSPGDPDIFGAQQYAPLMDIEVPI